jgi:hypothetical protein
MAANQRGVHVVTTAGFQRDTRDRNPMSLSLRAQHVPL